MSYGIPYKGSKRKLIAKISEFFPDRENFYDLFGGGFSVCHYLLKEKPTKYKQLHFNEIRPGICELIKDAIDGKYNYNVFKPEWITRDRFNAEKETNAYIKVIWSFGNNGKDYIFGKHIEKQKESLHNAIIFNKVDGFVVDGLGLTEVPSELSMKDRRLLVRREVVKKLKTRGDLQQLERLQQLEQLEQLQQLQQLERLERLEQLQQLQQLERLEMTSLDYRQVKIKPNSIVYCDIPYRGTAGYGNSFNHDEFFDWAHAQENPVLISEYNVDDNRFTLLKEFEHRTTLSATANNKVIEKLYCNRAALREYTFNSEGVCQKLTSQADQEKK